MILVQNLQRLLSGSKILTLGFLFISFLTFAQPSEDVEKEFKNGKEYWVHVVESGNTLYGIKRTYGVEIPVIIAHNPGMTENLTIGQKIYIPTGKTELEVRRNNASSHTVSKGETLYGLSKKYNCTQQELIAINPGIEKGLKVGQEIKVPVKNEVVETPQPQKDSIEVPEIKIEWNDSIVEHKVLKHETLYSISKRYMVPINELKKFNGIKRNNIKVGSIVKVPLKKIEKYEVLEKELPEIVQTVPSDSIKKDSSNFSFQYKDQYNVVVAMPFCLGKNASVMKKNALKGSTDLYRYTQISLDFYMGVMLALDSLKQKGLNVVVDIVDTKRDSATVSKFINSNLFSDADLIFGPFESKHIKMVKNNLHLNNHVRVIPPFSKNNSLVESTPQMVIPVTSEEILVRNLAVHLVRNNAQNNIIILDSGKDKDLFDAFKETYNEEALKYENVNALKTGKLGSSSGRDFASLIDRKDTNIILGLTKSRVYASKMMTTLNKVKNKSGGYDDAVIHTYGLSQWENFNEIKTPYKIKLNFHYLSAYHLDFNKKETKKMIRSYRTKYKTDPNKYAVQGFDLTYYFISQFFLNRDVQPVMNHFKMKNEDHSGQYNSNMNIIYYNEYSKEKK